jgi:hypothetical protein
VGASFKQALDFTTNIGPSLGTITPAYFAAGSMMTKSLIKFLQDLGSSVKSKKRLIFGLDNKSFYGSVVGFAEDISSIVSKVLK